MLIRSVLSGLVFVLFFIPIAFANKPGYIGPSVNAIVFSTENPKVLYVDTSDGVFKSIDRGLSWVFSDGVVLPTAKEGNTVNQKFEGGLWKGCCLSFLTKYYVFHLLQGLNDWWP